MRSKTNANTYLSIFRGRYLNWWTVVALMCAVIAGTAILQHAGNDKPSPKQKSISSTYDDTSPENNDREFGIAVGGTLNSATLAKRAVILKQIHDAGFTSVRMSLDWVNSEAVQGKINWASNDSLMKAVKKAGLRPIVLVDRAPVWARTNSCKKDSTCSPQNSTDYATFMAALASRYKEYDISGWEIWNEENSANFWKPKPDPEQYTNLLIASNAAIKNVNKDAIVLVGGLSGDSVDKLGTSLVDPRTYLEKIYKAGASGQFDAVAYHPYIAGIGLPDKKSDYNGWAKMNTGANSIRQIMIQNGDQNKTVWITEFGVPTGGSGPLVTDPNNVPLKADHASLEAQNQILSAALEDLDSMPWVREFDWYTYKDDTTAKTYSGAAYGVWQLNGTPKPILKTFQAAIKNGSQ